MRIAVCIKQVPVLSALAFDEQTKTLLRAGAPSDVSAFDIRALIKAVDLRTTHGGEVVVITMGPPQAREALEYCLALGADAAFHLCDPLFAGADTLATAHALQQAIAPQKFDLVLCGRASVDAETGQVGPELAELLDWPQVTCVRSLEVDTVRQRLRAERETSFGLEVVEAPLPGIVTAAEDLAPERFPSKMERQSAKSKPYVLWSASDLSPHPHRFGRAGSPTWVGELERRTVSRLGKVIPAATATEAAVQLAHILVQEHGLYGEWNLPNVTPSEPTFPSPTMSTASGPVWVIAEEHAGELRPVTLELLQRGHLLARATGLAVEVLLISPNPERHAAVLASHRADAVLAASAPEIFPIDIEQAAQLIAEAIRERQPGFVIAPATGFGRDVMPRIAGKLGLGLTGDCIDLGLDAEGDLVQYKPAFGGHVIAPIFSRTRPHMATVRPGVLPMGSATSKDSCPTVRLECRNPVARRVQIVETRDEAASATELDRAEVVIGIGMGIGSWENFALIEPLQRQLGAALCATRDVTDAGWLPKQYQVGITGRAIAPKLYLAIGIRGAFEHTASVQRAGLIVALNKSPKAPMFKSADYGIVGDYAEIVPALCDALRALRPPS